MITIRRRNNDNNDNNSSNNNYKNNPFKVACSQSLLLNKQAQEIFKHKAQQTSRTLIEEQCAD